MGFQTPLYKLSDYLKWTSSGVIQLPDFQREYKWEDERIRSLIVTVLRGHPLGVVMLLNTGGDQIRFKPKPLEGSAVPNGIEPQKLLLDGQQRLTSLTQALRNDGVVQTFDGRSMKLERKYYIDLALALEGEDRIDEAVVSLPKDGVVRSDFGRKVELDVSSPEKERDHGFFPISLIFSDEAFSWLLELGDAERAQAFNSRIVAPARAYDIPAIELDSETSKAAVATVFEKVNTGGLALNVFELLTATFAGDKKHFEATGTDFRLNDDWKHTRECFADAPVLAGLESTDFLQALTLLATRKRNRADTSPKPPAVSAKREDVLKLTLDEYLEWVDPLREAFLWAADFLADRHIFDQRFLPYPKQLVPLATLRVVMGGDADLLGPRERIIRWFWAGILGELYGGAIETRFVRDVEEVPPWARENPDSDTPKTVQDSVFVESRLHSLRTRGSAAYKGIYALLLSNQARDWMQDKALDKVQYASLQTDIHHIFPKAWCGTHEVDDVRRESIVNKTAISATTNRTIGGIAPSRYLQAIEKRAQIDTAQLDQLLDTHLVTSALLRDDDFDAFFADRRERLCLLVEEATGKQVQRDVESGDPLELADQFEEPGEADGVLAESSVF